MESILPVPELMTARKILAIQPHYDDNDIGAGGTLATLRDLGAEIAYLTVTDDLMGVLDVNLPDEMARKQLTAEQLESGRIIGVTQQINLNYPDAGVYDMHELRQQLIAVMRTFTPDFLFAPDPWLPYEAHTDHIRTGLAVAEASVLFTLPRIRTTPDIDAKFTSYELSGIAFYYTHSPNTTVDIGNGLQRKQSAIRCYQAQFGKEDLDQLLMVLEMKEQAAAEGKGYSHAEVFRVMHPLQLHCGI
jgi:LmbE family N-acetylglucosaminyl deacetylase